MFSARCMMSSVFLLLVLIPSVGQTTHKSSQKRFHGYWKSCQKSDFSSKTCQKLKDWKACVQEHGFRDCLKKNPDDEEWGGFADLGDVTESSADEISEVPYYMPVQALLREGDDLLEDGEYQLILALKDSADALLFKEEHIVQVERGLAFISIGQGYEIGSDSVPSGGLTSDIFDINDDLRIEVQIEEQDTFQEIAWLGSAPYAFIAQKALEVAQDSVGSDQIQEASISEKHFEQSLIDKINQAQIQYEQISLKKLVKGSKENAAFFKRVIKKHAKHYAHKFAKKYSEKYFEDSKGLFLQKTGGTLTGDLILNTSNVVLNEGQTVDGVDVSALSSQVTSLKNTVDNLPSGGGDIDLSAYLQKSGDTMTGTLNMVDADITLTEGHTIDGVDVSEMESILSNVESSVGTLQFLAVQNLGMIGQNSQSILNNEAAITSLKTTVLNNTNSIIDLGLQVDSNQNDIATYFQELGEKLDLDGGTLTGALIIDGAGLTFRSDNDTLSRGEWDVSLAESDSGDATDFLLTDIDGDTKFKISDEGHVFFPGHRSNSSVGANVYIDPITGEIQRTSSSKRYKTNIRDIDIDTSKVYDLRPVTYKDIDTELDFIGFIAEEVEEIYPEIIFYNEQGTPESLHYDRIAVIMLAEMKKLRDRVQELESQLGGSSSKDKKFKKKKTRKRRFSRDDFWW